jgi:hypothetical protein
VSNSARKNSQPDATGQNLNYQKAINSEKEMELKIEVLNLSEKLEN